MRATQHHTRIGCRARACCALVLLCVLSLTGCTITPSTFSSASADQVLTVWTYLGGEQETANFDALDELFAKRYPNVEVRYVTIPLNQLSPKLLAAAGTGEGPDVIVGNPVADFPLLSSARVYADLTPRWRNYPEAAAFSPAGLWRKQDRLYAIHWRFNDFGLWYNQDILEEYNLDVPRTVEDFDAAMRTIAAGGKYRPLAFAGTPDVQTAWFFMSWIYSAGGSYCEIGSPVTERVLRMLASWRDAGYLANDTSALGIEDGFDRLLTGEYAFALGGGWEVGTVREQAPSFAYGSTRVPAGAAGSKLSFAGESVGIGRYAANPDLAWEYLKIAYLSKAGQRTTFDVTGSMPPREDVRRGKEIAGDPLARPFAEALAPRQLVPWPNNPNTLDAQTAVGTTFSSMIAGELSASEAAADMRSAVEQAFEDGGGGC